MKPRKVLLLGTLFLFLAGFSGANPANAGDFRSVQGRSSDSLRRLRESMWQGLSLFREMPYYQLPLLVFRLIASFFGAYVKRSARA